MFKVKNIVECGGKLTLSEGTILSPNYPNNFDKNETCYWLIEVEKSHSINLIFEDVDLPQNCSNYYIKVQIVYSFELNILL